MRDFVQSLPKTETHLHLEGAIPYELLHNWRPERYPAAPEFHRTGYRFPDFSTFDRTLLDHALAWFISAERYHAAAKAIFARHVAQNVRYVETSFHLPVTHFINVPGPEIIAAIRAAVPAELEVRIFAGMRRTDYAGPLQPVIDDLIEWPDLAGVDLHGHERMPTEPWTAQVWSRLRAAGKITKCHAGEFDGPGRVREAIESLGVTRVEHGVRAIEDPAVLALAVERGVTFDVCPISNIKLGVYTDYSTHPLRRLMQAGIRCTVSTDDPLMFNNTVNDEYINLAEELNFTADELGQLAANGFLASDLPSEIKQRHLSEITRLAHV